MGRPLDRPMFHNAAAPQLPSAPAFIGSKRRYVARSELIGIRQFPSGQPVHEREEPCDGKVGERLG